MCGKWSVVAQMVVLVMSVTMVLTGDNVDDGWLYWLRG